MVFPWPYTPICAMASVHCAAATENFLVLENHSIDTPWWDELVIGLPNPIIEDGYITVPETPGLGIELNETVIKEHLHSAGRLTFHQLLNGMRSDPTINYGVNTS